VEKVRFDTGTQLACVAWATCSTVGSVEVLCRANVCAGAPAASVSPVMDGNSENFVGGGWSALPVKLELCLGNGHMG